jgi:hypothetical protein
VRKQFNAGVFHRLLVRDGRIAEVEYQEPFGLFFGTPEFEQRRGGAGDETRTRDIQLGRLALYQLSYSRSRCP